MSNKLDTTQTAQIADLIKIKVPQSDLPHYAQQLNTVLDAVPVLQELDTDDVEITAQTHGLTNVLREDEAQPGLDMSKYPNKQNFRNGSFVVNKVL